MASRSSAASGSAGLAPCADGRLIPRAGNIARIDAATLCLIDRERVGHGLRPLRRDVRLEAAARLHAVQMVIGDYFDHIGPGGQNLLQRALAAGYGGGGSGRLGENIAAGSGSLATPAASVAQWMRSPAHRAEILDPSFRDTGIGVTAGVPASLGIGRAGATYAEDFGTGR